MRRSRSVLIFFTLAGLVACSIDITGSGDVSGAGNGDGGPTADATMPPGDDSSVAPDDAPVTTMTTPDAEASDAGGDAEAAEDGGPDAAVDAGADAAPSTDAGTDAGNDGGANYALKFDGNVAGFVSAARPVSGSFTLEAWVNATSIASSSDYYNGNLVFYSGDSSVEGYSAEFYNNDQFGFATGASGTNGDMKLDTSASTVTTGTWTHLAIVRNQPNGTVNLYVNGVPDTQFSGVTTAMLTGSAFLSVGGDSDGNRKGFTGLIDEVRVWSSPRQTSDIANDYADTLTGAALTDSSLLLYWHFDEGSGTTATDSSPARGFPGTFSTSHTPVYQQVTTSYK